MFHQIYPSRNTPPPSDFFDGTNPAALDVWKFLHFTDFPPVLRHRTEYAAYALVALVVQLAMGHFHYFVQEVPHVLLRPLEDGRNQYRVLAAYAAHLMFLVGREIVLVHFLALALHLADKLFFLFLNLLFLPFKELLQVS